jgi:hypothetical protein
MDKKNIIVCILQHLNKIFNLIKMDLDEHQIKEM